MGRNTDRIDEVSKAIIENTSKDIAKVLDALHLEFENLSFLINNLSNSDKDRVIAMAINKLLEELKSNITMEKYHEIARDIDEITDYYMSKKEEFDVVIEEGDYIANELLFKVIGYNNQQLDLPIDVSCIRKYCLSSKIKTEQVYDVLLWIVIRYVTIQKCVSY